MIILFSLAYDMFPFSIWELIKMAFTIPISTNILFMIMYVFSNMDTASIHIGVLFFFFFFFFLLICHQNCFFFFPFIFISWRLITLQYFSGFCHTLIWISHGFTCVPHPDPPHPQLLLHTIPLGLPSTPGLSTCLMHPTWAGDLFHPR